MRRAARFLLAVLFLFSAAAKLGHTGDFAEVVHHYRILPSVWVGWTAATLPWTELLVAFSLLFWVPEGGACVAAGLGLVFFSANLSALARGLDIRCGCFSLEPSSGQIGWPQLLLDVAVILAAIWLSRRPLKG